MNLARIKKALSWLENTWLHPQWLVLRERKAKLREVAIYGRGVVLDIGCGDRHAEAVMHQNCQYVGLDYYRTAIEWYGSRPHIFGNAQQLPLGAETVDCVLLLDVLEHLPEPVRCMQEIHRVLRPGGRLIVQVPYMYPIHDAPLDFHRWTHFGLRNLAECSGFSVQKEVHSGSLAETAGLFLNIALSKNLFNCIRRSHPGALLILIIPFVIPLVNVLAYITAQVMPNDNMMSTGLRFILDKKY